MRDTVYLIVEKSGAKMIRKTKPALSSAQVAVRLHIEIPDEFFERIVPDATLVIPEEAVLTPPVEMAIERTWENS